MNKVSPLAEMRSAITRMSKVMNDSCESCVELSKSLEFIKEVSVQLAEEYEQMRTELHYYKVLKGMKDEQN